MLRSIAVLLTGSIMAVSFAQSAVAQDQHSPRFERLDTCFIDMPEGIAFDCGNVIVPEFHDLRTDATLSLGVIRLNSTSEQPKEPIFFGAGGPGGYAFQLLEVAVLTDRDGYYANLLSNHDLVFFAQRGTAYSEPFLGCFGVNDLEEGYLSQSYDSWQDLEQAKLSRLTECHDAAVADGVDLTAYNSLENAADVDGIRRALGYDQIIFYGESYGTLLGQHLMRDFPDTLTAVVLDGAMTTEYPSWETDLDARFEGALAYLVEACASDPDCQSAFPNFEEDLMALHSQLQDTPYEFTFAGFSFFVDAEQFALAIYNSLYDVTQLRFVPLIVDGMLNDRPSEIAPGFFIATIPGQGETSLALLMHFAVLCSEDPTSSLEEAFSLETLRFGDLVTDYVELDATEYITMCAHMDLPVLPDETDSPVESEIPVLILNGAFDPVTPERSAAPITAALPNAVSVNFAYGDHVQGALDECAHSIMTQFFEDPTSEPDTSCASEQGTFSFAMP